ncbi:hypothetical protein VIMS_02673 [Mycobacterium marinum]|nr:hypothetical protein VIMS_02673 [Mycobacterium marinum]
MRPGVPANESTQLQGARRGINAFESETAIVRRASTFLGEDKPRQIGSFAEGHGCDDHGDSTRVGTYPRHEHSRLATTKWVAIGVYNHLNTEAMKYIGVCCMNR